MASPPFPVDSALHAIGNTPVVRLRRVVPEGHAKVFLKLEYLNPTGSYKDRMAKSMIEQAESKGKLQPGMTVVEASGGSTGSSLAFVCAIKGYQFRVASSNAFAVEKLRTMRALGATVDIIHNPSGCVTADLIPSMIHHAQGVASQEGHLFIDQFNNTDSLPGYDLIGKELIEQFPNGIDAFCGMFGAAGMVTGVSRVLKSRWPETRFIVLEPESSPILTEGHAGSHSVEGVGVGFIPPHLNRSLYDEAWGISEEEGRTMCRRLAKEEGLLVGTSTGLNVVAAIALAKELGPDKTVVTVAVDTGLKYMNGNLFADDGN